MKALHDIHDRGYKKLFRNKTILRQLIETFVDEPCVRELDFDQCEPLDKSFLTDHYKETESDLIYKVRLKGREAYIVILLEFQSTVEQFMALRVLNYITNFYMDYVQANKGITMLPPVFPIVLYNGPERWTAPLNLAALITDSDLLGRFAVRFEYFPIVEQAFPPSKLMKIHNLVSTLFLAESQYESEMMLEHLSQLFDQTEDREAFWLLINWFLQLALHERFAREDIEDIQRMITTKEEVKTMLEKAIAEDRRKYYEQGLLEGEQKAKLEGERKAKLEDAQAMFALGLEIDLIRKITGLPEQDLVTLQSQARKTPDPGSEQE